LSYDQTRPPFPPYSLLFSFTTPAPSFFHTLSLHDALPICIRAVPILWGDRRDAQPLAVRDKSVRIPVQSPASCATVYTDRPGNPDRMSTRLNSSHLVISYAVFCLKKKKKKNKKSTENKNKYNNKQITNNQQLNPPRYKYSKPHTITTRRDTYRLHTHSLDIQYILV